MNKNVEKVEISGIRKFFNLVNEVDGAISLTLGQPDFNVPESIKAGIVKALEENKTEYTSNAGILPLRERISSYLESLGISFLADEICITIGGSEGLYSVLSALVEPGEKVLIPAIGYPAYENILKIIDSEPVTYNLNEDFTLNIEDIEGKIKKYGIRKIILSYPSNPTGAILSLEDRKKIAELIKKYDIIALTDEIYSSLCYDEYYSIAQVKELKDNIIYIGGFSKMFSMTGLRIGFIGAASKYMKEIMKVHQYNVSCAPSIIQWGIYYGFDLALEDLDRMKKSFVERRDLVYNRLKSMEIEVVKPKGAFYIFPSIKKYNISSKDFCEKLLFEKKLACVPGDAFGVAGDGFFRISYCYSKESLIEALDIIEQFISEI
ncbi:pyridoxal phosphate-dependent aminotransferase [Clostridium paridis]|uniref:Aminotransferase n=1 Tax=Clostridium paridis TaxID=2803863 RepID=A0A937FGF1_9CLOT|nr:aminotransferase class I/II-fold pyridoxal phosphate-dependent enzyme [Clostridium paridis]MBL4931096.1 aminotransferase class I/II-fold pyridoxal phosphate-dependent enzyme [Clostridium paridis]